MGSLVLTKKKEKQLFYEGHKLKRNYNIIYIFRKKKLLTGEFNQAKCEMQNIREHYTYTNNIILIFIRIGSKRPEPWPCHNK